MRTFWKANAQRNLFHSRYPHRRSAARSAFAREEFSVVSIQSKKETLMEAKSTRQGGWRSQAKACSLFMFLLNTEATESVRN